MENHVPRDSLAERKIQIFYVYYIGALRFLPTGLGLLPRLPPPTCARPVSGVGLGPSCSTASRLWFPGPRPLPALRFVTVCQ